MAAFKIALDVFYLTRLLSVKSVVIGSIFPIATTLLSKPLAKSHQLLQSEHSKAKGQVLSVLTEALQRLHQIRFSSLERFWQNRIKDVKAREQDRKWAAGVALQKLNLVAGLGPVLLASTCISVHAWESGQLSPSVAFTAISLFGNLQGVFSQLPQMAASLHKSWLSIQKIQEFLLQPDQVRGAVQADAVFLENASFAWPGPNDDELVKTYRLKNVMLSFPRGKLSIVTGRVGSGKSLLLAALLDEAVMVSGRLGKPTAAHPSEKRSEIIQGSTAFVSQPPWIDNCTIKQNVVFGYSFNSERYKRVLVACALEQDLKSLSNGDETMAGTGGASLSGGQKWRIALARALYSPAEILILEDVLGAVDTSIATWICENALTGKIAEGRTIILATHRPEFCLPSATYHVTVEGGTATGTTQLPTTLLRGGTASQSSKPHENSEESKGSLPSERVESPKRSPQQKALPKTYWQSFVSYIHASGLGIYLLGVSVTIFYQILRAGHIWSMTLLTESKNTNEPHASSMEYSIFVYLLLSIGSTIMVAVQSLIFVFIGLAASSSVFTSAIQAILNATLGWIASTPFGEVYQVLDNDMHVMDNLIAPAVNGILGTMLQLSLIITTR
jgi:ABC-type multidrug transport system fused ATPase/permease subunit